MDGQILETAVVAEEFKTFTYRGMEPHLHFWQTSAGAEVDLLVETAGKLVPIEVKLSVTPPAMVASIKTFQDDLGSKTLPGYVVHPADIRLPLGPRMKTLSFARLQRPAARRRPKVFPARVGMNRPRSS